MRRVSMTAVGIVALLLGTASPALADDWHQKYEAARKDMLAGRYRDAEAELHALAESATNESDRTLAREMAGLAAAYADRQETTRVVAPSPAARIRSGDELTLLYTSAFLYGAGTGVWYLLETQPDSAVTATLPFAVMTAAPVLAVATLDGYKPLPRGVPHAISAGLYLGLGEGLFAVGFQHARSGRLEDQTPGQSDVRWKPETVAGVLWGGATLGATLGGALGSSLVTTPGRVSFTASTTVWSGTISGLAAGALLGDGSRRAETAWAIGDLGYNAGLASGLLLAGSVSPTVARVRIVDLLGLAGGLSASGFYLTVASHADVRTTEGLAAGGALLGLAAGWVATSGMEPDVPRAPPPISWQPTVTPRAGGATLGIAGTL